MFETSAAKHSSRQVIAAFIRERHSFYLEPVESSEPLKPSVAFHIIIFIITGTIALFEP